MRTTIQHITLGIVTTIGLVACGGGGGGGSDTASVPTATVPTSLKGTAAVGSPIVGATVVVKCAKGLTLTSPATDSDGSWSVVVRDQTFPCAVQLTGGTIDGVQNIVQYHSIALGTGTANITPLTDLMVAFASKRSVPSDWFNGLSSASWSGINANVMDASLAILVNTLQMTQLGNTVQPITTSFSPHAGNVMDDSLSALSAALHDVGMLYGDLRNLLSSPTVTPSSNLVGALVSRYRTSESGVRTFGGVNSTVGVSVNGSPNVAVSNCGLIGGGHSFMKCNMNAIANFGPVSVVDRNTGKTCTASYTNGTLSVSNGTVTVNGYLNGNILSDVDTFASGDVSRLNAWASTGRIIQLNTLTWDSTGRLKTIYGTLTTVGTGTTEFTCSE